MILSQPPNSADRHPAPAAPPTVKGTFRFSKADRLRRRRDYLRVQAEGRRLQARHFGVVLAPPETLGPRLGLVVTRRFGQAARRNRMKRLLREFFRCHKALLPPEDLVIMAKKGAESLSYRQLTEELERLLFSGARGGARD